jgi:hypothetical protein
MRRIKLTQGYFALVDDEDYQRVMAAGPWYIWRDTRNIYAVRSRKDKPLLRLHAFILGVQDNLTVHPDHINHNGLDCRKKNLRLATVSQNAANRRIGSNNTSGYKGVSEKKDVKRTKHWRANAGGINLGCFATAKQAALAYDAKVRELYGEFAYTNF